MGLFDLFGGGKSESTSKTDVSVATTVSVDPRMYTVVDFKELAGPLARLADAVSGYGTSVERAAVTAVRGGVLASLVGAQSSEDWLSTLATVATIGGFGISVWWLWKNGDLEGLV